MAHHGIKLSVTYGYPNPMATNSNLTATRVYKWGRSSGGIWGVLHAGISGLGLCVT